MKKKKTTLSALTHSFSPVFVLKGRGRVYLDNCAKTSYWDIFWGGVWLTLNSTFANSVKSGHICFWGPKEGYLDSIFYFTLKWL